MSLHGLRFGWPHRTNTHHSCILEPSGKELFLVTDQPINWLHLVPCPSLAVSFGLGVVSSRANLAASTCSLWDWRGKNFQEGILSWKDRQWGLYGAEWEEGQSITEVLGGILHSPLEDTCINGPTVCVKRFWSFQDRIFQVRIDSSSCIFNLKNQYHNAGPFNLRYI